MMKPSRFGIFTFGSVWAFIVSFSPMSLMRVWVWGQGASATKPEEGSE
ncbi:MAG: hypothetical protein Q8S00_28030 [Deltaproteobacteria bacterium]|nr:hypothetical protein [Deltaproteobacteria bacterium]MDZ4341653.1 hypothetical protein [Candidatus Binatia bacterium]